MTQLHPRKRPRQRRSEVTVEAILEATARILEERGLDSLTTNAVAELAGVSVGSLYQFFPNKTSLLAELIRRQRSELCERVTAVASQSVDDLELGITELIGIAVAFQLDRPKLARALDYIEPTLPLDAETASFNDRLVGAVAQVLKRFDVPNPDRAATDLIAIAKGIVDVAGLKYETDRDGLTARVAKAAMGYLR